MSVDGNGCAPAILDLYVDMYDTKLWPTSAKEEESDVADGVRPGVKAWLLLVAMGVLIGELVGMACVP